MKARKKFGRQNRPLQPARLTGTASRPESLASGSLVRLAVHGVETRGVFLAGSFNDWRPSAVAGPSGRAGEWAEEIQLPDGVRECLFVVHVILE